MPAFTATTTPQRVFHSSYGDTGLPTQFGIQVQNGATGTVWIAKNEAGCVKEETNYFSEDSSITSVELKAGQEVWVCTSSGTVVVVYNFFGAG